MMRTCAIVHSHHLLSLRALRAHCLSERESERPRGLSRQQLSTSDGIDKIPYHCGGRGTRSGLLSASVINSRSYHLDQHSDEADRGENAACAMDASVKRSFSEANVPSATNSSTNFSYTCSTLLIVCISELLTVRIRGCSKLQSRNRLMPGDSGLFAEVFDWAFR
jgi:hypothetical protein